MFYNLFKLDRLDQIVRNTTNQTHLLSQLVWNVRSEKFGEFERIELERKKHLTETIESYNKSHNTDLALVLNK